MRDAHSDDAPRHARDGARRMIKSLLKVNLLVRVRITQQSPSSSIRKNWLLDALDRTMRTENGCRNSVRADHLYLCSREHFAILPFLA